MVEKEQRRAKVTPETKEESRRLKALWDVRPHATQAEFGDANGIGGQSAVGQFLRGNVPLSLKAARGFAHGLGCRIEDFSPRLAMEAATIANMVPGEPLAPEIAAVASALNKLPQKWLDWSLIQIRSTLEVAQQSAQIEADRRASQHEVPGSAKRAMPRK